MDISLDTDDVSIDDDREQEKDNWMLDSLKRYRTINMFDAPDPISTLTWLSETDSGPNTTILSGIFVSDKGQLGSDLLCMRLPDCLLNSSVHHAAGYDGLRNTPEEDCQKVRDEKAWKQYRAIVERWRAFAEDVDSGTLERERSQSDLPHYVHLANIISDEADKMNDGSPKLWKVLEAVLMMLAGTVTPLDEGQYKVVVQTYKDSMALLERACRLLTLVQAGACRGHDEITKICNDLRTYICDRVSDIKSRIAGKRNNEYLKGMEQCLQAEDNIGERRDFKITGGGLSSSKVVQVNELCSSDARHQRVVTSHWGCNSVSIWQLEADDTGAEIRANLKSVISNRCPNEYVSCAAVEHSERREIAFGSHLNEITVYDTFEHKLLAESSKLSQTDVITSLHYVDRHHVVMTTTDGSVYISDTRSMSNLDLLCPGEPARKLCHSATSWSSDRKLPVEKMALLYDDGHLKLIEFRKGGHVIRAAVLFFKQKQTTVNHKPHVAFCPHDDDIISVSGFDGSIYVFDTTFWSADMTSSAVVAAFVHDGHMVCSDQSATPTVLTHAWHPTRDNTLLSSASDCSIHVWEPNLR